MKDKNILNSKKFAAFFFALAVIASVLIVGLIYQPAMNLFTAVFMIIGIIGVCGLAVGYILSQKALDKFLGTVQEVAGGLADRNPVE